MGIFESIAAVAGVINLWQGEEQRRANESAANESRASQERQYRIQQQQAEVSNIRSVRQQIRQARLRQAQLVNVGAQKGGLGSSSLAGAVSSAGAQTSGNINYLMTQAQTNAAVGAEQISAARTIGGYQSRASVAGAMKGLSGTIFETAGGFETVVSGAKNLYSDYIFEQDWEAATKGLG